MVLGLERERALGVVQADAVGPVLRAEAHRAYLAVRRRSPQARRREVLRVSPERLLVVRSARDDVVDLLLGRHAQHLALGDPGSHDRLPPVLLHHRPSLRGVRDVPVTQPVHQPAQALQPERILQFYRYLGGIGPDEPPLVLGGADERIARVLARRGRIGDGGVYGAEPSPLVDWDLHLQHGGEGEV